MYDKHVDNIQHLQDHVLGEEKGEGREVRNEKKNNNALGGVGGAWVGVRWGWVYVGWLLAQRRKKGKIHHKKNPKMYSVQSGSA